MVFRHRAQGSGQVIETMNPIYDYSTGNGGPPPPYGKHGSTDSIQHRLQAPKGNRERYDDRTEPRYSPSGANYPVKSGKSAAPNIYAPKVSTQKDGPRRRQMTVQDRFARGGNKHG